MGIDILPHIKILTIRLCDEEDNNPLSVLKQRLYNSTLVSLDLLILNLSDIEIPTPYTIFKLFITDQFIYSYFSVLRRQRKTVS